ncbi:preprotein translocase subunit SecY [Phenylobacterium sp.]|jgi:preprotein translocase subunit SecY|uniref:preprotein translocase subunit SecY n=1 Tax=Phenylobacterium sp. TaxID=1871053 RepID=UPI0027369883|nr:preprotein translocase subunit SecY [Phenylobacterium sp.]MBW0151884.1 preprotein translocase subunit SecY [Phenylobacterium sp.]MDP3116590.1 preprotein translocase subunit SecY [Phenylobacterium sp.]MDP3382529.1 preprotein translocase subunit SecY [Phenylobacterium sp.]MDZ4052070.1 preprotein translocase subunit SecY [Phenylobacterium sp.]
MASAAEQLAANLNFGAFQKATELHKRIGFTLLAMIVYRLGTYIPIPGIDPIAFAQAFEGQASGILGMFNMFSGGAVERMAIFALNVMPYISASIIVQLLGAVYPPWEKLRKEGGEAGRKTLNQYTRYLTVVLAVFQSAGIAMGLSASQGLVQNPGPFFIISTVVTLTGGTLFLMWLGEQITSRGVGNGISLIIFAGIVAVLPRGIWQMFSMTRTGALSGVGMLLIMAIAIAVVIAIVFMERSQRRLLVQYPKRQQGNRMVGGDTSFLPLKINTAGVIPPIFASSLLLLPTTVMGFLATADLPPWAQWLPGTVGALQHGQPLFMVLYGALIIFFCFFYTSIVFNPDDTAENLRKYGGFLPGIRPGKRTAEYLDYVLTRLTVIGAAYITIVCLLPEALIGFYNAPFYLGGTSILIVVTVTMDTVTQIQSHLLAHQYEGLIKKSKLRGGRGRS